MNRWTRAALTTCLMASVATATAEGVDAPRLLELGHHFPSYVIGDSGLVAADFDGDAVADLAFAGLNGRRIPSSLGTPLLFVAGRMADGRIAIKQELLVDLVDVVRVIGHGGRLYAVSSTGTVNVYGQWPLRLVGSLAIAIDPTAVMVGDVNGDGIDELLVASAGILYSHSTATGALLWQTSSATMIKTLVAGQLDADAALEIVASSETTSVVVDGATGVVSNGPGQAFSSQAGFLPPFGTLPAQIVDATSTGVVAIQATAPWLEAWSFATPNLPRALMVADVDGDGRAEAIYGDTDIFSEVHVLDTISHGERLSISGLDRGIKALAAGDIDDDGVVDIAFSFDAMWYQQMASRVRIVDTSSGKRQYDIASSHGRFSVVALADFDGDGSVEQFAATADNQGSGRVIFSDLGDGRILWDSGFGNGTSSYPFDISAKSIAVGRLRPDGPMQIVLGAGAVTRSFMVLIDGVSHQARELAWRNLLRSRSIGGVALVDVDRDGQQDIAVLSSADNFVAPGATIHVFSATTGALLAETSLFGGSNQVRNLLVGDVDGDEVDDLIAVLGTTVSAFDSVSLQPRWTLAATSTGGSYNARGLAGAELMLFNGGGGISFFDARSRQFLRSIAIPASTTAVIALGGDSRQLLSASSNRLLLLDGSTGTTLASSPYLGTGLAAEGQIAAVAMAPGVWQVAVGSDAGYFRHRLETAAAIFQSGFDQGVAP